MERARLALGHAPQPLGEGHRVGVAGGDDPVADVDDVRLRARTASGPTANALSRSVQPSEPRAARNCRAAATFFASAGAGLAKTQSQSTSQVARLNLSFGRQRRQQRGDEFGLRSRGCAASIEAEVSARISSSSGSPSGSSSRAASRPLAAGGRRQLAP